MKIEMMLDCRNDPNNRIIFEIDNSSKTIGIITRRGMNETYIALSRYELKTIVQVIDQIPIEPFILPSREKIKKAYDALPPDCKIKIDGENK